MKPHKHAELIKAWADGAQIELLGHTGTWVPVSKSPNWNPEFQYRIKPKSKPVLYLEVTNTRHHTEDRSIDGSVFGEGYAPYSVFESPTTNPGEADNLKLTFDLDGRLIHAEVIKK